MAALLLLLPQGHTRRELYECGRPINIVEQKFTIAMQISYRVYVMGHGRIVFEGTPADLSANEAVRKDWLEV
jgi:branched-chain amino acid transport system ATP-binding protein